MKFNIVGLQKKHFVPWMILLEQFHINITRRLCDFANVRVRINDQTMRMKRVYFLGDSDIYIIYFTRPTFQVNHTRSVVIGLLIEITWQLWFILWGLCCSGWMFCPSCLWPIRSTQNVTAVWQEGPGLNSWRKRAFLCCTGMFSGVCVAFIWVPCSPPTIRSMYRVNF